MNSENLGLRIMANKAWNQKIWALEAFRPKAVFSGGSGVILEFLKWLEGFCAKDSVSCKIWGFLRDFCGILEGLKWFRTYS
jgi:hypothetical protein